MPGEIALKESCRPEGLTEEEVYRLSKKFFSEADLNDKNVLVIIPDNTRSAPVDMFFRIFFQLLAPQVKKLDYIIAAGTHPPLSEDNILRRVGITGQERRAKYSSVNFFNHYWNHPAELKQIGTIPAEKIHEISGGLLRESVPVKINRIIFDYDVLIVVGPVFPHEVAGFSGGNKYFFPGIAGPEIINLFHWLGALVTNRIINGTKFTPVRKIIDCAADFIPVPCLYFNLVVDEGGELAGLFAGSSQDSWEQAADLSAQIHIVFKERPFKKVIGVAPDLYNDLWTAAKVMYKLEPVVADGGELIIYAPHISEISYSHGKILEKIGYHVKDYFLHQPERFAGIPGAVRAHSTHLRGTGTYVNGIEKPRIRVILATGISEKLCRKVNLEYRDPASIDISQYKDREDEGILLVPRAGEKLFRLKS